MHCEDFFRDDRLPEQVQPGAAPFGGRFHMPEAELLCLFLQRLQHLVGQRVGVVRHRLLGRDHAFAHETPSGILHGAKLVRQFPCAIAVGRHVYTPPIFFPRDGPSSREFVANRLRPQSPERQKMDRRRKPRSRPATELYCRAIPSNEIGPAWGKAGPTTRPGVGGDGSLAFRRNAQIRSGGTADNI